MSSYHLAKIDSTQTSAPTLTTILMVEDALSTNAVQPITVAQLKTHLPRQVNHNVLKIILKYLESSNKISVSLDGITWIHVSKQNSVQINSPTTVQKTTTQDAGRHQ